MLTRVGSRLTHCVVCHQALDGSCVCLKKCTSIQHNRVFICCLIHHFGFDPYTDFLATRHLRVSTPYLQSHTGTIINDTSGDWIWDPGLHLTRKGTVEVDTLRTPISTGRNCFHQTFFPYLATYFAFSCSYVIMSSK